MIITIDLWGTLIKGSPSFKVAKYHFIRNFFNLNLSDENIENIFMDTKKHFNAIIENTGWQPTMEQLLRVLFSGFGITHEKFDLEVAKIFYEQYQQLAIENPPLLYSNTTLRDLEILKKEGHILKLSSNTLFIAGPTLKLIMKSLGLNQFSYYYFSDLVGFSKPNFIMYKDSYLHIGDNIYTDKLGPKKLGIASYIINSNDKTLTDAVNYILTK